MHHRRVLIRLQSLREHIRWTGYPEVREQPVKQLDEGTLLVPGLNLQAADRQEPQRMRSRWCGLWDSEFIKVDVDILQMQLLEARTVLREMDEGRATMATKLPRRRSPSRNPHPGNRLCLGNCRRA